MKKELTKEVGLQVNAQYQRIKKLLLSSSSYEHDLKTDNMGTYLSFVENALDEDMARIMHIYLFIEQYEDLSEIMYPFSFLNEVTKQKIEAIYYISIWVTEGFEKEDFKIVATQSQ